MIYSAVHHPASKFMLNMKQFRAAGGIGSVYHVSHARNFLSCVKFPLRTTPKCVCGGLWRGVDLILSRFRPLRVR